MAGTGRGTFHTASVEPTPTRAKAGRSGIGATLSPGRVPVKDRLAPIAVARCTTQDFAVLILRFPALRIFCPAHVDPQRRAAPSGRSCPCEGVGDDDSYGQR